MWTRVRALTSPTSRCLPRIAIESADIALGRARSSSFRSTRRAACDRALRREGPRFSFPSRFATPIAVIRVEYSLDSQRWPPASPGRHSRRTPGRIRYRLDADAPAKHRLRATFAWGISDGPTQISRTKRITNQRKFCPLFCYFYLYFDLLFLIPACGPTTRDDELPASVFTIAAPVLGRRRVRRMGRGAIGFGVVCPRSAWRRPGCRRRATLPVVFATSPPSEPRPHPPRAWRARTSS